MLRSLLALVVCVALLMPQGFTRVALWVCEGDGAIHAERCCDHDMASDGSDDCCHEIAAGEERGAGAIVGLPPVVVVVSDVVFGVVLHAVPLTAPRRWQVAPAAIGPPHALAVATPLWLEVRSLRM